MANEHFDKLIHQVNPAKKARMSYDSGEAAGIHARGNVLLGDNRYLTSLKSSWIDKIVMDFLF